MTLARRAGLLPAVLAIGACGVAGPDVAGEHAAAITSGSLDAMDEAVGALRRRRAACGQPAQLVCSGTLIAPRVFLTAAHCLADVTSGFVGLDQLEVVFGLEVDGVGHAVVHAEVHPRYDPAAGAHDLALLVLDAPAPVAPAARGDLAGATSGDEVRLVGYGAVAVGGPAGAKHTGVAAVDAVDAATVRLAPAPSLACSQDSGGAVVRHAGELDLLVGVIRSGDAACASFTVATRVDAEAGFVEPFLATVDARVPAGRPPDPAADFCAEACASDDDCATGMRCLADRAGGRRCGYADVGPGTFGDVCATDADCASGRCAAVGSGDGQACRCLVTCAGEAAAPSDGCAIAGGGLEDGAWLLLLLAVPTRRRSPPARRRPRSAPRRRRCGRRRSGRRGWPAPPAPSTSRRWRTPDRRRARRRRPRSARR